MSGDNYSSQALIYCESCSCLHRPFDHRRQPSTLLTSQARSCATAAGQSQLAPAVAAPSAFLMPNAKVDRQAPSQKLIFGRQRVQDDARQYLSHVLAGAAGGPAANSSYNPAIAPANAVSPVVRQQEAPPAFLLPAASAAQAQPASTVSAALSYAADIATMRYPPWPPQQPLPLQDPTLATTGASPSSVVRIDAAGGNCFKCGQPGHWRVSCPYARQRPDSTSTPSPAAGPLSYLAAASVSSSSQAVTAYSRPGGQQQQQQQVVQTEQQHQAVRVQQHEIGNHFLRQTCFRCGMFGHKMDQCRMR